MKQAEQDSLKKVMDRINVKMDILDSMLNKFETAKAARQDNSVFRDIPSRKDNIFSVGQQQLVCKEIDAETSKALLEAFDSDDLPTLSCRKTIYTMTLSADDIKYVSGASSQPHSMEDCRIRLKDLAKTVSSCFKGDIIIYTYTPVDKNDKPSTEKKTKYLLNGKRIKNKDVIQILKNAL